MTIPIVPAASSSAGRCQRLSMDALRHRALDRLYQRRSAVENLIAALEQYQRARDEHPAGCVGFSATMQQCSSSSAQ